MIPAEAVEAALSALLPGSDMESLKGGFWWGNVETILEAAAPHMLNLPAPKPKHQCEPWQIQVNASGTFRYCAACGEPQP